MSDGGDRTARARVAIIGIGTLAVVTVAIGAAVMLGWPVAQGDGSEPPPVETGERRVDADGARRAQPLRSSSPPYRPLPTGEVALLPEARYDAVIPGLLDATDYNPRDRGPDPDPDPDPDPKHLDPTDSAPSSSDSPVVVGAESRLAANSLLADAPLYGADRAVPVARLAAVNFLGEPTVVVPVLTDREWTLVLTPARQALPSSAGGDAAAQTSGWIRTDALVHSRSLPARIVVSISAQSLTIISGTEVVRAFDVGVGTPGAPTPRGVTGYLQARYLDPAQGQAEHRVQLTTLHSSAADEPYGGTDGGLIGLHYSDAAAGAVSHGCIRLSTDAVSAVDALPLGTSITVVE